MRSNLDLGSGNAQIRITAKQGKRYCATVLLETVTVALEYGGYGGGYSRNKTMGTVEIMPDVSAMCGMSQHLHRNQVNLLFHVDRTANDKA